jgi:hypothetical protein
MKKTIFPFIAVFTLIALLVTIEASSQEVVIEDGGKVTCYGRWTTGGVENFTQCNGCSVISNVSSPADKSECRP